MELFQDFKLIKLCLISGGIRTFFVNLSEHNRGEHFSMTKGRCCSPGLDVTPEGLKLLRVPGLAGLQFFADECVPDTEVEYAWEVTIITSAHSWHH